MDSSGKFSSALAIIKSKPLSYTIGIYFEFSITTFSDRTLSIKFRAPFEPRRGRVNCSLNDNGKWRWFGIQFPIKTN